MVVLPQALAERVAADESQFIVANQAIGKHVGVANGLVRFT
jgi:hypothetical protein